MKMTLNASQPNMLVVEHWAVDTPELAIDNIRKMLLAAQLIWPRQLGRYDILPVRNFAKEIFDASRTVHEESRHPETQTDVEPR